MSTFGLNTAVYDHPQFVELTPAAFGLWVKAVAHSIRHNSPGYVSDDAILYLSGPDGDAGNLAGELVHQTRLVPIDGGFQIVDFDKWVQS